MRKLAFFYHTTHTTLEQGCKLCITLLYISRDLFTCQHKASHRRDETRKESIIGKSTSEDHVHKLDDACQHNVHQVAVNHFETCGSILFVRVPKEHSSVAKRGVGALAFGCMG